MNQRKLGVVLSFVSTFAGTIASLIYVPIQLGILGSWENGIYAYALAIISNLSLLQLGLDGAFTRFYTKYAAVNDKKGIAKLNGVFMTMYIAIAAVTLLIGGLITANASAIVGEQYQGADLTTIKTVMMVMTVNYAINFLFCLFDLNIMVRERYVFAKLVYTIKTVCTPIFSVVFLLIFGSSIWIAVATTLCTLLMALANVSYCVRSLHLKMRFGRIQIQIIKQIFTFSSFILLSTLVDTVNWALDGFVLGRVCTPNEVTTYDMASKLGLYYLTFSKNISTVFSPMVHMIVERDHDDEALTGVFTKVGRIQTMITMAIILGFIPLGKFFTQMWAKEAGPNVYYLALILFIAQFPSAIQTVGLYMQQAKDKHKFRSVTYFFIMIANFILSYVLAKPFGVFGVAAATLVTALLGYGLVMNWYYKHGIGLDIGYFWRQILALFKGFILPAVFSVAAACFVAVDSIFTFLLVGIGFAAVYGLSLYAFGMNDYEKNLIVNPLKRLVQKLVRRK